MLAFASKPTVSQQSTDQSAPSAPEEENGGEIWFAGICCMCAVLELVLGVSSFFSNTQPLIEDFETIQNAVLNLGPQEANDHFTCYKINPQFPHKGQVAPVETEWAFV